MNDVEINGVTHRLEEGLTILAGLARIGVTIPGICHDPRARAGADCRLCSVQVEGEPRPVTACTRKLTAGMRIETHTPELESFRRSMLEFLARHCTPDSFAALPEKELHRWMAHYGVTPAAESSAAVTLDDSHPHFQFDPAQCVACYRCVRVCEDLQASSSGT